MPSRSKRSALYKSHPELILNLGSCLAVLAIVAIVSYLVARERSNIEQGAARQASNIVQLIESDIVRNVELYDLSLRGLIWAVKQPQLQALPAPVRQQLLFNQAFTMPIRGDILWLDAQGNVAADSTSVVPRQANFADSKVFQAHRQNADLGLVISPPFKARLGNLDWCISFSRRISGPNGEFAGVAAGALRLSYFTDLFKRLDIGKDGSISLINTSGVLLARQSSTPDDSLIGANFAERPNFKRLLADGKGSFSAYSGINGKPRLYTFARVAELPLIVLVARSGDEVFASWRRTALLVSCATGVLCIGILWLTLLLGRELRRRHCAEQDLAELAATDSLTGLANRRQLDQVLRREWSRAQRNHRALAVLMVDVDHFKAFNERHGHQGGDEALRAVATAIARSIRRPADLAARYGGEEFLVVLPETERHGAQVLAERIRRSVEALPAFADDTKPVTVSIGIGCYKPGTQQDLATLLGSADDALYCAKRNGRNRVETAP
ncbi:MULTISPECIES: diguanylate cyclase [Pseudomonas]|uniref:diguanylate cyclase n=1 Tax=Pseudomonas sp. Hg7Tf TaxID=3236988 RepID=A0AB39IA59_9PSED|nr:MULTISPECIES: sensor domain-containing diguanylate cyclase [Pseudomonas]KJK08070.1 deoxyribonuclease [Pseudomonas sp. 5]MDD1978491.1 sensor domain-containing diguanylate cyclase [Pseudomonas putida]MDH2561340.1 sensor domain-containing diguanylate cyclase [Pseudomonas sp. Hg5Tf]QYX50418.1 sensor domain-containing diguanylate cyclase [Pseudomonas sp. S11A 273]